MYLRGNPSPGDAVFVGIIAAVFGLRFFWKGLTNQIWRDLFGEPNIPRWCYFFAGIFLLLPLPLFILINRYSKTLVE